MGHPKQLLEIGGATMVERVVSAVVAEVDEVVLFGAGPVPAAIDGLARVSDADGCGGPMAGILGGMRERPNACWIVSPCDLPLLRRAAVRWLLGQRRHDAWAVLPSLDGFVEPLFALYEPGARALLESAAAAGELALHRLAAHERVVTVEAPADLRACWFNANTPYELASLLAG
jgi:molybdopterin-guanine dinucleotide biosynthesis protein A